jgi:3-hydroxyanthranilate 3,4-dioxygenase
VQQLPPVMEGFYSDEQKRTCGQCGAVMERPVRKG